MQSFTNKTHTGLITNPLQLCNAKIRAGLRDFGQIKFKWSQKQSCMLDSITLYVRKSMVIYCCCVRAADPAAYSMLLYNEMCL